MSSEENRGAEGRWWANRGREISVHHGCWPLRPLFFFFTFLSKFFRALSLLIVVACACSALGGQQARRTCLVTTRRWVMTQSVACVPLLGVKVRPGRPALSKIRPRTAYTSDVTPGSYCVVSDGLLTILLTQKLPGIYEYPSTLFSRRDIGVTLFRSLVRQRPVHTKCSERVTGALGNLLFITTSILLVL